jgi:hypothetical protein
LDETYGLYTRSAYSTKEEWSVLKGMGRRLNQNPNIHFFRNF